MKKAIICLLALAGFAACSREKVGVLTEAVNPIEFSGMVEQHTTATSTRGFEAVENPQYQPMNGKPDYGTVFIRHTPEAGPFSSAVEGEGTYSDMDKDAEFIVNFGSLNCTAGKWYWNENNRHLFHAWNMPTKKGKILTKKIENEKEIEVEEDVDLGEETTALVKIDDTKRFGEVLDFSMNHRYSYTLDGITYYYRSNLEYFIGAVKGPVSQSEAGTYVVLPFRHLVAKIIVSNITYVAPDGSITTLKADESIPFCMPNMPKHAYWETGIPETVPAQGDREWNTPYSYDSESNPKWFGEPHVTLDSPVGSGYKELKTSEDYGVTGKLNPGDAFYVFPCEFGAHNKVGNVFDEIQFRYRDAWYYGSLEEITAVTGLKAGDCISVTIRLMDGRVKGLYPHIVGWNTGDPQETMQHDRYGIYSVDDWKKLIDWLSEWKEDNSIEPPAGLFDNDDLNIYGNLDLTELGSPYSNPGELLTNYFTNNLDKHFKGNGHRIKTKDGSWLSDSAYDSVLKDFYVSVVDDSGQVRDTRRYE